MRTMISGCLITASIAAMAAAADKEFKVLFDGKTGAGWILCDQKPLPACTFSPTA